MDLNQLRYPVVCWSGRTPRHEIRSIAIAFPQSINETSGTHQTAPTPSTERNESVTLLQPKPRRENEECKQASTATPSRSPSQSPDLICRSAHPPHAFIMTGSLTGELAHWYIPSYRSSNINGVERKRPCGGNYSIPRALLLRQGAACCTALTYCRDGLTQMFCGGTSEGFLTLWSVGGGRCIRSELVLPFAPTQILFYQRYNPLAHSKRSTGTSGGSSHPSPSPSPTPFNVSSASSSQSPPIPSVAPLRRSLATTMHNYLLCCSEDNHDVYVVELPSLTLLCILQHRANVMSMALVPPAYSKQRTPYLVTVTAHHHICLWDLSLIEKKYEEKKKIRVQQMQQQQRQQGNRGHSSSNFSITVSSPGSPIHEATFPTDLSHPVSSLASNSASIIAPGPLSASTATASIPPGLVVVKWDEPSQSFMLPLPPFSFTLSPLFVPTALCLSPCGSRAIVVFPYAFLCINMNTFEVEGDIHSMATFLRNSAKQQEKPWNETDVACITQHAPWIGAGYLTVPSILAGGSSNSLASIDSHSTQYLILWNANGEFIWIFSVTTGSTTDSFDPRPLRPSPSQDELSSFGNGLKRSLSSHRAQNSLGSPDPGKHHPHAFEAPELTSTTKKAASTSGSSSLPRIQLVGKCLMFEPKSTEEKSDQSNDEHEFKLRSPKSPPPVNHHPHTFITVQLSGHTIFAGTEDGSIYQWHIPLCSQPQLFTTTKSYQSFQPTHVSRMADAFSPITTTSTIAAAETSSPQTPIKNINEESAPPHLSRAYSTPSALESPRRPHSPTIHDPPTASTMLIDPWHEAMLLAVGHATGSIKIFNVLSKATTHLNLDIRHQGIVTCMLNLAGWMDACMLATAGVDGRIHIIEMSTGTLQQTLSCHVPILSLHKPSVLNEDQLSPYYRGANANLLFANCSDSTLRCFSLTDGQCIFIGRSLDSPVKVVFRPSWAILADLVLTQTMNGTLYIFSMSSSHLVQMIDLEAGANVFLQKHDLIVPGSQLSILAHRLYQMKHLRKKTILPPLTSPLPSSSPDTTPMMSRSGSNGNLKSDLEPDEDDEDDTADVKITIDEKHFSFNGPTTATTGPNTPATPNAITAVAPSVTSYETAPPLSRTRSAVSRRRSSTINTTGGGSVVALNPRTVLTRQRTHATHLIDSQFQRDIYRLNQQHQLIEQQEEEHKKLQANAHPHHAAPQQHYSALNPPVPGTQPKPLHHSPSVSAIINPQAAAAAAAASSSSSSTLHPPTSTLIHGSPIKPSASSANLTSLQSPGQSGSPSPPATGLRSPIACVDVVTSAGSSSSPLQHLHANVYVWNVHQLLPFLAAHATSLVAMVKRSQAIAAARADPNNLALTAAANAARAVNIPPAFYVLCGLLSTLFDWDSHSPIEASLRNDLKCYSPSPPTSFASLSDNSQAITLLLPNQARDHQRWTFDSDLTARHALAITSTVMHLLDKSDPLSPAAPWFSSLLYYYHVTVPKSLRLYVESDINVLAVFALNIHRPIHTAARLLIQQTLERLSPWRRLQLTEEKGRFFEYALPPQRNIFQPEFSLNVSDLVASGSMMAVCENGHGIGYVHDEEMMNCMLLCWIGFFEMKQQRRTIATSAFKPVDHTTAAPVSEGISEFQAKSQFLTNTLLRMIAWPVATEYEIVKCALACELLAKGLIEFRHHITEPLLLLRRLYSLSQHSHDALSKAANNALLDAGKISPTHFITCIGKEAMNYRATAASRQGALMCIVSLIKKHPLALARALPSTIKMIVETLDPAEPTLRKTLLQASTSVLYTLTARYPQISFHQTTQRFAVGTANGVRSVIIVYDLRTATKWRLLEGHTGDIHAVSFHPKGLSLASYSATEDPPSVRVWSTGGGGFLSGLLGMEGKCTHSWPMLPCKKIAPTPAANPSSTKSKSASTLDSSSNGVPSRRSSYGEDEEDTIGDVDEPVEETDEDEKEDENDQPRPLAPRPPVVTSNVARHVPGHPTQPLARYTIEELLSVKIMWISDKTLKLKREDGSMLDFSMG